MFDFKSLTKEKIAQMMDYSNLNPNSTKAEILRDCDVAIQYNFKGFHVNPIWVKTVADHLEGTGIETGIVVSFPFGTNPTEVKVLEAQNSVRLLNGRPGVIDMVSNVGALRGGDDYELLFTAPAEAADRLRAIGTACGLVLTPVGQIVAGTGVVLVGERADGGSVEQPIAYQGYDHFPDHAGGDDARRAR